MKVQNLMLGVALMAFSFGCASREKMAGPGPTPTPGEMEAQYMSPPPSEMPVAEAPAPAPEPTVALMAPPPEEAPAPPVVPTPAPIKSRNSYIVRNGDSLWLISGKQPVLGDHFRWPLLFKANRKHIKDPDLIDPGMDLTWNDNYNASEVETALQKAKDTPKYQPHTTVRKQLPVGY